MFSVPSEPPCTVLEFVLVVIPYVGVPLAVPCAVCAVAVHALVTALAACTALYVVEPVLLFAHAYIVAVFEVVALDTVVPFVAALIVPFVAFVK